MNDIDRRVFETAFSLWASRGKIYDTRRRLKRYTYGDQWADVLYNDRGDSMIESALIRAKGRQPITNNLIRRLIKTIVGRYRDMATRNKWYSVEKDTYEADELLEELDSRLLEEFLISGMAVQRVGADNPFRNGRPLVSNVNPEAFFCNDYRDPRGYDLDVVGMLHDMSPAEVMLRFGGKGRQRRQQLQKWLTVDEDSALAASASSQQFFVAPKGRCRIVEVWTREYSDKGAVSWRARWFTAAGILLDTYESAAGSHPFAIKFYPLTDGEIHSFVEDVVDQQRYINRLIVLIDSILKTSAKGVLLFPETQRVNMTYDDIAERWANPGSIIPIKGNSTLMPQQLSAVGGDGSAYRLLEMELKLFDQTAGVGTALLGSVNAAGTATGVEHYQAQVENATIALADIFRTFRSLIARRDSLLIANSQKPNDHEPV